jgi:Undecaprenyl-phosphate glucose phosphotransferase
MRSRTIDRKALSQPKGRASYSLGMASGLVALADEVILLATGNIIYAHYIGWGGLNQGLYTLVVIGLSLTVVALFNQAHLYDVDSICNPWRNFLKILGILALTFLVFLAFAFSFKVSAEFSRVWVFSWFLMSASLIFLGRLLSRSLLWRWARAGRLSRKIVVIGAGEQSQRFLKQVQQKKEPWLHLVGIFDDRHERVGPSFNGFPVLGTLNDLLSYVRKHRVDDIIVTLPWSADQRLLKIIEKLEELPVHIRLSSDLAGFLRLRPNFSSICGVSMLDMVNKPLVGWRYVVKEVQDKILGLFFLALFSPLMLLIALAIKLESDGPVLFRQKRYGFNNEKFGMLKFRSMYHERPPENGVPQARRNDPRVTHLGKFLRKTSMDELPQLLNVLGGTMSIVGPRPHAVEHNKEYSKIIRGYYARHRVKPGLTGWAQVNGLRGETDTPEKMKARVEYDVYYIKNCSLLLDIKILIMTAPAIFRSNAY